MAVNQWHEQEVLKGDARSWFENWDPEQRDWDSFKVAITDLFPLKRNLAEKLKKAVNLTSDSYASYCEYTREKLLLLKGTKIKFYGQELVELVIGDIREISVKMGAINSNLKTISELIILSEHSKKKKIHENGPLLKYLILLGQVARLALSNVFCVVKQVMREQIVRRCCQVSLNNHDLMNLILKANVLYNAAFAPKGATLSKIVVQNSGLTAIKILKLIAATLINH